MLTANANHRGGPPDLGMDLLQKTDTSASETFSPLVLTPVTGGGLDLFVQHKTGQHMGEYILCLRTVAPGNLTGPGQRPKNRRVKELWLETALGKKSRCHYWPKIQREAQICLAL